MIRIGTAGWSIPRDEADAFAPAGTALERYATRFPATEINSSFHRPHRDSTWQRWRDSVPADFRFSVKMPKAVTHQRRLADCTGLLAEFLDQVNGLGDKLAVLLVQLPPKLDLDPGVVRPFFRELGGRSAAAIACEPRHPSWFTPAADDLLEELAVARVGADPAICEAAARPSEWNRLRYWRLHGSPVIYRSSYADRIGDYAAALQRAAAAGGQTWCILDNTASSAAIGDALALQDRVGGGYPALAAAMQ